MRWPSSDNWEAVKALALALAAKCKLDATVCIPDKPIVQSTHASIVATIAATIAATVAVTVNTTELEHWHKSLISTPISTDHPITQSNAIATSNVTKNGIADGDVSIRNRSAKEDATA